MENFAILILFALILLSVIDLIVGVSNDAVNFLNSAIGSKAIPIRNIMLIASMGIAVGAVLSSGMMEVARKGIFVPAYFHFEDVIWIFMAVMLTDVLLLDVFNMFGMPTSTTVSIVFELLGAAVSTALIKIYTSTDQTHYFWDYINSEKALQIILGIFLSVIVAFTIGALVQYISRLLYSFKIEQQKQVVGTFFGGFALMSITYFIFIKGLKGTPYYSNIKNMIEGNTALILLFSFVFFSLFSFLFIRVFRVNILKIIIAIGTFSLAMAFAGNDLVNFIGVPIAAWSAYEAWHKAYLSTGVLPNAFSMDVLSAKVSTNSYILLLAGFVMVVTLWFSKKAKEVIKTGIDLSREGATQEKFTPNQFSRSVVRFFIAFNEQLKKIMHRNIRLFLRKRFEKPVIKLSKSKQYEMPAFDLVRASVNLIVAAILISIGTSLKLPLSTTYVTFMVAMGTSLADKAWGQETAVYRVAGVFNVISGWFLTAAFAFTIAGLFAYILYLGDITAMVILLLLVLGLMVKNYLKYLKKNQQERQEIFLSGALKNNVIGLIDQSTGHVSSVLLRVRVLYDNVVENLINQDVEKLKKSTKYVSKLNKDIDVLRDDIFYFIKELDDHSVKVSKGYILVLGDLQSIAESMAYIAKISYKHVNNNHKSIKTAQVKDLKIINKDLVEVLKKSQEIFENKNFDALATLLPQKQALLAKLMKFIEIQIKRIRTKESSPKNTTLYFGILLETKDLISSIINLTQTYQDSYLQVGEEI